MNLGDAIVIGSTIFGTMGVVIKLISVKAGDKLNGNGLSYTTFNKVLDTKLDKLVSEKTCRAQHFAMNRMLIELKETNRRIFDRLEKLSQESRR